MIRSLLYFKLNPLTFARGVPGFCVRWLATRSLIKLALALPAVAVTALLIWAALATRLPQNRQRLAADYLQRASAAAAAGELQQAEILYRRAIPQASDPQAVTVEFARVLLKNGEESRAVRMLTGLAPLDGRGGYQPAFQTLADYHAERADDNPSHRVRALRYRLETEEDNRNTRLQLVEVLAQHRAFAQAIHFLRPVVADDPKYELLLARLLDANGLPRHAETARHAAVGRMQESLRREPANDELRRRLLYALAEQGRLFDALTVALEGCSEPVDPATVDMVTDVYAAWMATLPPRDVPEQLQSLRMTIDPAADIRAEYIQTSITRADGTDRDVHECFAGIHRVLLAKDSQWLVELLLGTAAVGDDRPEQAITRLRRAHQLRPDHPVIANNLAWVLWKSVQRTSPEDAAVILDEANVLANRAVTGRPEYASFHETQARILLAQQRLPEAEAAIDRCADLGLETTLLRQQLMDVEADAKAASETASETASDSASESAQTSDAEPAQAPDDDSSASLPRGRFDAGTSQAGPILTTFLQDKQTSVRIATFNASLNRAASGTLISDLQTPDNRQAQAVAEIIQRTRPDVLLINEFDFDDQGVDADSEALRLFRKNYLQVSQNGCEPIQYDFHFTAPSNTGVPSGMDLNNDGMVSGGNDAFGFGEFPGQYGMVLLSKYPIIAEEIRTFQKFLWKDMPDSLLPPDPADSDGDGDRNSFFTPAELDVVRLSSKSHWDIPVDVGGQIIHVLASHPTPPVFDDGRETDFENPTLVDRNGRRNHDEIRFWTDYVAAASYIYDDNEWTAAGNRTPTVASGGLKPGTKFVILGDLNADPHDGDNTGNPAAMLLNSPLIGASPVPTSSGAAEAARVQGQANAAHRGEPAADTADFGDRAPGNLRVDYVLPSANLKVLNAEVFWPDVAELNELGNPNLPGPRDGGASDHRLVFVDLSL